MGALKLLKPGGYIGISDFTVHEENKREAKFWKGIFAKDNVHPNPKHLTKLRSLFKEVHAEVKYGGFPYVPLAKCPYYYFIDQKSSVSANGEGALAQEPLESP